MIRIGIVDDEEMMRLKIHQCIKEILKEQEPVEIRSYDCAEAFLEEIQKKVHFDILFSDIQMLEMNGLELGKGYKRICRIFISSILLLIWNMQWKAIGLVRINIY